MAGNWERRWQPLLEQWVMVSARTATRPWSGAMATGSAANKQAHDENCYLCPRVIRANGTQNPDYKGAFAFDNDFPSLSHEAPSQASDHHENVLTRTAPSHGQNRVLCWSEKHNDTLAALTPEHMRQVVHLWKTEYETLCAQNDIANVLIFENKGEEIGVSNLHPHGQIYATSFVTDTASRMRTAQANYAQAHAGSCLLVDLLNDPHTQQRLLVEKGEHFSVIVPFAARFAFETWIVPHIQLPSLAHMNDDQLADLARLYQRQTRRYDLLFKRSAPNITLLHNAPCDDIQQGTTEPTNEAANDNHHWCFHLAFQPPLRDPEKLKFLAGFESGANNIVNPVQPEQSAEQLRKINVSEWAL